MKKNKMMRIASVLLVAVLLSTCAISGTFAKYTTTITANDTAKVASFNVTAFDVDTTSTTANATVNIFNTVCDTEGIAGNDYTGAPVADDDNVDDGATTPIIAPGTWGKFTFDLTNNSEVKVNYSITYDVNEAGVPLEWSIDGKTWTDNLANVTATEIGDDTLDFVIYWRWAFAGDDVVDTALGATGTASPSRTITVLFEQVD